MILTGEIYNFKKTDGRGYDQNLQKCIEDTCQYCIDNTFVSAVEKISKPIMMLGKIQSGKTNAFTGLVALAFDNDFDVIFILTKNSKALIKQTVTRMRKEFKPFIDKRKVFVEDIIKINNKISGFQLERKNIIVSKKEKNNINKLLELINNTEIYNNKKCLIIDDEADTTGIGYNKKAGTDEFTLRTVSSKVNEVRGSLDGCVFVEVTATPYALYLQPDFDENGPLKPIKPLKTILVPYGDDYIGGDYYFIKSKDDNHPASLLFESMKQDEGDMVSNQKRKGKKSKIDDRRSFKEEEILYNDEKLPVFKKGIINFIVGSITLREIYKDDDCYSYVIHTATQKNSHFSLQSIAETFLTQIRERSNDEIKIIETLLYESYCDIEKTVTLYGLEMLTYDHLKEAFFEYIDREYYSIDVVNADQEVDNLLNDETGELSLRTPCSIFVGGQVLDRGVTIPNMIGFYYGRNPKTMQQDTVLQHSRMFGYRMKILPVTRFYTTNRIHSNMEKITEIDITLREEIELGIQGNGVYFITNKEQDNKFGYGKIKPCSPDKIRASDILVFKPYRRILPIGFMPVSRTKYSQNCKKIDKILNNNSDYFVVELSIAKVTDLLKYVYNTFESDEDGSRFVNYDEFLTSLLYMLKDNDKLSIVVKKNKNNVKIRRSDRLEDAPDNGQQERQKAIRYANTKPVIILLNENGDDESWNYRQFWWPILIAPKLIDNTIYAAKIPEGKINVND